MLDVANGGAQRYLRRLDAHEMRIVTRKEHPQLFCGSFAGKITLISESGLYKLIMRSNTPSAREFQDFVTGTMLVSIRKTGGYLINAEAHADTRTEMPLPAGFGDLLTANFAMAELLAKAVRAQLS